LVEELRKATSSFKRFYDVKNLNIDYSKFFKNRVYPRFFMSLLYLHSKREYYYGVVNDCFCILKKKMIGMPIVYLIVPPINGDITKEKETIDYFNSLKIKTRLSDEDINLYDYTNVVANSKLDEYIYDVNDVTGLVGNKYAEYRKYIRKFNETVSRSINYMDFKSVQSAVSINANWEKYKKSRKNSCHVVDNTLRVFGASKNFVMTTLEHDNTMFGYDLSESLDKNNVIIVTRYLDYNNEYLKKQMAMNYSASYILHYETCKYWSGIGASNANLGSSVGIKHLALSKQRLKPVKLLKMFEFDYTYKFTKEEWNAIC